MLLIQGYVACLNLTLTGPMQCLQLLCQSLTFSLLKFKCTLQAVFCRIFPIHFGKEKATLIWALTKIFSCQVDINTTSRLKSFLRALTNTQNGSVEL